MAFENKEQGTRTPREGGARRERKFDKRAPREDDGITTKTVSINRVTKVVKGGRNMRFAALVVAGDNAGKIGVGLGKAREVPEAIEKANKAAKKSMVNFATVGTTIPHAITGVYGRGKVFLMPAEEGTGVIAGGPVRTVLEVSGIKDIRAKSIGSNNPINCVKATIEGLKTLKTIEMTYALRGKELPEAVVDTKKAAKKAAKKIVKPRAAKEAPVAAPAAAPVEEAPAAVVAEAVVSEETKAE